MNLQELDSFRLADAVKFHTELNPKLFDSDEQMHPRVRNRLLEIAQDFVEHLGIKNLDIQDITLSGSNAAYSYTPHSDIDLHILVDMNKINNDSIYRELFDAKKYQYNDQHDITIGGYDVELYVQDAAQPHHSLGEYSVLNNRWIRIPTRRRSNFDEAATKLKYQKLGRLAELAIKYSDLDQIQEVLDTVRKYRKAGLSETGEFGPENLAFKALRKTGVIQKLYDTRAKLQDQQLSLDEQLQEEFKTQQEVIDYFVRTGRSAAQGAAAWNRGYRGSAKPKLFKPAPRSYHDDLDDRRFREIDEGASGYIPSKSERNDPRYKTALTVDVKPNSIQRNAAKLGLGRIKRSGIPPTAKPSGEF